MASDNHTPIQHIVDDHNNQKSQHSARSTISGGGKEGESREIAPEKTVKIETTFEEKAPSVENKEINKYVKYEHQAKVELDPKLKQAGLSAIDTSTLDAKHRIQLPLPDEKVIEGLNEPITTSVRWLAEFAMYLLHKGHLTLKKIHGHVLRVMVR